MKMKFTKKIATILLSVCLIVPCFSVMALAANGVIFFSDLETSVGDEFTITGTAVVSGDVIGDATIHMTYDPSYMRFEEGDGVNADTDGNLTFKGSGDGSSDRIEFTMKFQALQEGSTRLEQGDATVTDSAGSSVACEEGYADDTIGAGDNFASGFITGLLEGKDIRECAIYANCTAAVSVQYVGATGGVTDKAIVDKMLAKYREDYK